MPETLQEELKNIKLSGIKGSNQCAKLLDQAIKNSEIDVSKDTFEKLHQNMRKSWVADYGLKPAKDLQLEETDYPCAVFEAFVEDNATNPSTPVEIETERRLTCSELAYAFNICEGIPKVPLNLQSSGSKVRLEWFKTGIPPEHSEDGVVDCDFVKSFLESEALRDAVNKLLYVKPEIPECPICLEPIDTYIYTRCPTSKSHRMCAGCSRRMPQGGSPCPLCRTPLDPHVDNHVSVEELGPQVDNHVRVGDDA